MQYGIFNKFIAVHIREICSPLDATQISLISGVGKQMPVVRKAEKGEGKQGLTKSKKLV